MRARFAPSLLCMDLLRVGEQLKVLDRRADCLHVDLMDLRFVDNLGLSPAFVRAIRPAVKKPIDCHVMGLGLDWWVGELADAGADGISVHLEAAGAAAPAVLEDIRARGCRAGLVLSPGTGADQAERLLPLVDKVTVMTVEPGFPGAPFLWDMLPKIAGLARLREKLGLSFEIEMDGSCADGNFQALRRAGTDVFVVGAAALFGRDPELERAYGQMERAFLGPQEL